MSKAKANAKTNAKTDATKGASKTKRPTVAAIKKLARLHEKYSTERAAFMQTYNVNASYVNGLLCNI